MIVIITAIKSSNPLPSVTNQIPTVNTTRSYHKTIITKKNNLIKNKDPFILGCPQLKNIHTKANKVLHKKRRILPQILLHPKRFISSLQRGVAQPQRLTSGVGLEGTER